MKTLHTAYRVGDLDRSLRFYSAVGFREVGRVPLDGGTVLVMLSLPGDGDIVTLELAYDPAAGLVALGDGFSHVAVQVEDLAATLADLDARGVVHSGVERPGGEAGTAVCNLRDPDGYRIELVQWPPGHPDDMTSADFR